MEFDATFRENLLRLFTWRRDVRHFRTDPLPAGSIDRLLRAACLAPSVGLSQPWRFVLVDDPGRRAAVRALFEDCNREALARYDGDRAETYARLKLAGLRDAPSQIGVFADRGTQQGHGLGRLTMPETIEYSTVTAIHTLWLMARSEGIGLGWVSILDPAHMASILDVPAEWRFIGQLCLGYPAYESDMPELERAGWEQRQDSTQCILHR